MRIYIDFDDVLCETARALSGVAKEVFNRDVPYDKISMFDLRHAFSLSGDEIARLMELAHESEFLAKLDPVPDAVESLEKILEARHEVVIVTGRPSYCHEGSLRWMKRFGLESLEIIYVDKYGRAPKVVPEGVPPMLSLNQFNGFAFDVAIDDSPAALDLLAARDNCSVIVFDRPWNRAYKRLEGMRRFYKWGEILGFIKYA